MPRHSKNCGNCAHNCCCNCPVLNCYLCRQVKSGRFISKLCSYPHYPTHFVCFGCRFSWKRRADSNISNEVYRRLGNTDCMDRQSCPTCNKPPKIVPSSIRVPKYRKTKEWNSLEKHCETCPTAPSNGFFSDIE